MDRLIEDYEKALTEEFGCRVTADYLKERIAITESEQIYRIIGLDPKLPQWKAKEIAVVDLAHQNKDYQTLKDGLADSTLAHNKAKIRLAVTYERIELTKARLYGGRHELLDMQEMASGTDPALD